MKSLQQRALSVPFLSSGLLSLLAILLPVQSVLADEPVNVTDISECRKIEAKAERLLCFDTVADGGIFNEQELKKAQVESFGSTERKADISIDELNVTIVRMQKDANGIRYFQTSDGQVWKQEYATNWNKKVPFEVEIEAGVLGSYFMKDVGGKSMRVIRVR